MLFIYNFSVQLYYLAVCIAALWNQKAKEWIKGRRGWASHLEKQISPGENIIWIHCSSAGEFEQGKPIIEKLKPLYPDHKILVSFFSPSGYKTGIRYTGADIVTYLPLDTRQNAKLFIQLVKPELVIFVKYEFWYYYLSEAAFRHIPVLLVSAVFRENQAFFKWYGRFYRQMLFFFRQIFVQDDTSLQILQKNGIEHCSYSGDSRFDRVKEIADKFSEIHLVKGFIGSEKVLVAGSTWNDDERLLGGTTFIKIIIAPHEINESNLVHIEEHFRDSVRYSQLNESNRQKHVLIIDNIGMLSRLYKYATIAYVGGGFTRDGIHNILEAAVYGKPVLFGPNFKKYREANELIEAGGAFSVTNKEALKDRLDDLLQNANKLEEAGRNSLKYTQENTGATQRIIQFIQAKRLLTS